MHIRRGNLVSSRFRSSVFFKSRHKTYEIFQQIFNRVAWKSRNSLIVPSIMWINKIHTFGIKASSSCSPWSKLWWTMFPSGPWWCLWRLLLLFFKFPPSMLFFKFPPPTTLLQKSFKWLNPAKNKFHLMWFHEFFQNRFQQIHLISVSGHCKCFIFKICQNVAAICVTIQFYEFFNLIFGGFLSFETSVCW